jgi:hypothetical protein
MIKRVALGALLVVISGLLMFGAVHRTDHVLAGEGQQSGSLQVQGAGSEAGGGGGGRKSGLGNGNGRGVYRNETAQQGRAAGDGESSGGIVSGDS